MRITYPCMSFELPEGFEDQSSIQIARPIAVDAQGRALAADTYPLSIALNRDHKGKAPSPTLYLKAKLAQLQAQLPQFQSVEERGSEVAGLPAARAHFTFVAKFQLAQLVLVWFVDDTVVTATLSTTPAGVTEGWQVLDALAETIDVSAR